MAEFDKDQVAKALGVEPSKVAPIELSTWQASVLGALLDKPKAFHVLIPRKNGKSRHHRSLED